MGRDILDKTTLDVFIFDEMIGIPGQHQISGATDAEPLGKVRYHGLFCIFSAKYYSFLESRETFGSSQLCMEMVRLDWRLPGRLRNEQGSTVATLCILTFRGFHEEVHFDISLMRKNY